MEELTFNLQYMKGYSQSNIVIEKWLMLLFYINENPHIVRPTSKVNSFRADILAS